MVKKIINSLIHKPFDIIEDLAFGVSKEKKNINNVPDKQQVEIGDHQSSQFKAKEQAESLYPKLEKLHPSDEAIPAYSPIITNKEKKTTATIDENFCEIECLKYQNDLDMKDIQAVNNVYLLLLSFFPAYLAVLAYDQAVGIIAGIFYLDFGKYSI